METKEVYKHIVGDLNALEQSSDDVKQYLHLLSEKTRVEAEFKLWARDNGSYEDELLNVKVSMPKSKYSVNDNVLQSLATPEDWATIQAQAMDWTVNPVRLQTLIDNKKVSKSVAKAIEDVTPQAAVTIKLK